MGENWRTIKYIKNVILKSVYDLDYTNDKNKTVIDCIMTKTPLYFKVDAMRIIIANKIIKNEKSNYIFVFANVNMAPMSRKQLLGHWKRDKFGNTLDHIKNVGLLLANNPNLESAMYDFENCFFMLSNYNKQIMKLHKLLGLYLMHYCTTKKGNVSPEAVMQIYNRFIYLMLYANGYGKYEKQKINKIIDNIIYTEKIKSMFKSFIEFFDGSGDGDSDSDSDIDIDDIDDIDEFIIHENYKDKFLVKTVKDKNDITFKLFFDKDLYEMGYVKDGNDWVKYTNDYWSMHKKLVPCKRPRQKYDEHYFDDNIRKHGHDE